MLSTASVRAAPRMLALIPRRAIMISALTRNTLPRRLFPCDMLLARNASSAAATARIPSAIYEPPAADEKDPLTAFSTLHDKLHPNTIRAIKHTHMSVVQARIFPLLPALAEPHHDSSDKSLPRDLLVKAKTGTGKTMAFLVPAIESRVKAIETYVEQARIDSGLGDSWTRTDATRAANAYAKMNVGTLILSPTRELATQISVEASNLTAHHQGFQTQLLLGGESRGRQIKNWSIGRKDVVVATPGRLMDLLESEPMFADSLKHTKILILDEADTLLDMGFRADIERISKYLPAAPVRQTFLFSATVSKPIQEIARTLLARQHTFVNCVGESDTATHTHIPQYTTTLPSGADAIPHLIRLLVHDQLLCAQQGRNSKVIVFLSTTKMTQLVADILAAAADINGPRRGRAPPQTVPSLFPLQTRTYEMHAKRDMSRRMAVSAAFRADTSKACVLITSDVSARGVDYPGVTRVIQIGIPGSADMYVHRVGRTGRGGDCGGSGRGDIVLTGEWEKPAGARIARQLGVQPIPVTVDQVKSEVVEMLATLPAGKVGPYTENNVSEIESWATTMTQRIGEPDYGSTALSSQYARSSSETISDAFISQLGFYVGRIAPMGLTSESVVSGLQKFFREMCGLTRDMTVSRALIAAMGLGNSRGGGRSQERGMDRSRGSYAPRGSEDREGYRHRSSTGGSYGYSSAAPSRHLGQWEGATGRGRPTSSWGESSRSSPSRFGEREGSDRSTSSRSASSPPSRFGDREGRDRSTSSWGASSPPSRFGDRAERPRDRSTSSWGDSSSSSRSGGRGRDAAPSWASGRSSSAPVGRGRAARASREEF